MKFKNIEVGKEYLMKTREEIFSMKDVEVEDNSLYFKGSFIDLEILEKMFGKKVKVIEVIEENNPLNIIAEITVEEIEEGQYITSKFLKKEKK